MKNILVPTDFSKCASDALHFAKEIADKSKAQLHLLHVIENPVRGTIDPVGFFVPMPENTDYIKALMDNAKENMDYFCESIGHNCNIQIEIGTPYFKIMDTIEKNNIDLIVMGTKGVTGLKEFFIGSNSERIVRSAECPVITVHSPSKIDDVQRIVVAVDVKEISESGLENLKRLQKLFDAEIHLVHINTPNNFERDQILLKTLKEIPEKHQLENTQVHVYNDIDVERGILSFAEYINAGLIVMTTHGRKGLAHFIAGSTCEDVVNHATRPVCTFQG